jgi:hypothetical protein
MSRDQCPREPEVVQALRRGALPEELRGHAEDCPDCREALTVAARLRELAAAERPGLPTAGQIWWRAEVVRRLTAESEIAERAARPAVWGMLLGLLVAAGGLVLSLVFGAERLLAGLLPASGAPVDLLPIAFVLGLIPLVLLFLVGLLVQET